MPYTADYYLIFHCNGKWLPGANRVLERLAMPTVAEGQDVHVSGLPFGYPFSIHNDVIVKPGCCKTKKWRFLTLGEKMTSDDAKLFMYDERVKHQQVWEYILQLETDKTGGLTTGVQTEFLCATKAKYELHYNGMKIKLNGGNSVLLDDAVNEAEYIIHRNFKDGLLFLHLETKKVLKSQMCSGKQKMKTELGAPPHNSAGAEMNLVALDAPIFGVSIREEYSNEPIGEVRENMIKELRDLFHIKYPVAEYKRRYATDWNNYMNNLVWLTRKIHPTKENKNHMWKPTYQMSYKYRCIFELKLYGKIDQTCQSESQTCHLESNHVSWKEFYDFNKCVTGDSYVLSRYGFIKHVHAPSMYRQTGHSSRGNSYYMSQYPMHNVCLGHDHRHEDNLWNKDDECQTIDWSKIKYHPVDITTLHVGAHDTFSSSSSSSSSETTEKLN